MKRTLFTAALLSISTTALARRSDAILASDPNGIYVTIISVGTVLVALVVLFLLIALFAKVMVRSAQKKAAQTKVKAGNGEAVVSIGCDSVVNGELIAAIALAIKMNQAEMHDQESDVITINKVARVYSPWSSKIHGLTPIPERIRK